MERNLMCSSNDKHVQLGYILSISTTLMQCKISTKCIVKYVTVSAPAATREQCLKNLKHLKT